MTVHIDEMTTSVEYEPTQNAAATSGASAAITQAMIEQLRRTLELAARRAQRTRAEGLDD